MIIPSCKYAPLLYSSSSFVLDALYSVIIVITSASDDWLHTFVLGRQQQQLLDAEAGERGGSGGLYCVVKNFSAWKTPQNR